MKLIRLPDIDQYKRLEDLPENTYFRSVHEATKKYRDKCASAQDVEILEDFYSRIVLTSRALSIKDDQGFYPANYFVFMPIPLFLIRKALKSFTHCGFLKNKHSDVVYKFVKQVSYPTGVFGYSLITEPDLQVNTKLVLESKYKLKSSKRDGTLLYDFTLDEKFEAFLEKVYATIEKFDLPNADICCTCIGHDIARGRAPINLKGMEEEIERDRK